MSIVRRLSAAAAALACVGAATVWAAPAASADSIRDSEWPVAYLNLAAAQQLSNGRGVTVGLLDTGVVQGRVDLTGQVSTGPDYAGGVERAGQPGWGEHGTCMASIIAGHGRDGGGAGMLGVAPGAHILSVRVIRDDDAPDLGEATKDDTPISDGIKYAVDHGAKVISMSLGGDETNAGDDSSAESDAIRYALAHNVVVVAAAGNGALKGNQISYPGAERGVITVAAVDSSGKHADFSTTGWDVAVAAPGVDLPCDAFDSDNTYLEGSGTSQATAYVAGVVALLKSENPLLSPAQIRTLLEQTAKDKPAGGRNDELGFGVVDPVAALKAAKGYTAEAAVPQAGAGVPSDHFGYGPTTTVASATGGTAARTKALAGGGALVLLALAVATFLLRRPKATEEELAVAYVVQTPGATEVVVAQWGSTTNPYFAPPTYDPSRMPPPPAPPGVDPRSGIRPE
ncbi:S8 family serine peptidase [Actinospica robiniae]|uniref:S8 family serine peptidase n=1 Tax=Actinospica robiniae TaxID=304901 RepID=UPI00040C14A9|nr:S8 family serine peptidase [Actinospica robiniae]